MILTLRSIRMTLAETFANFVSATITLSLASKILAFIGIGTLAEISPIVEIYSHFAGAVVVTLTACYWVYKIKAIRKNKNNDDSV